MADNSIEIPFGKKRLTLGTPHRVELILIFLYVTFLLWFDILQNKVQDLGRDYAVTWVSGITTSALDLAIVMFILFHITLMGLFLMSLRSKGTSRVFDIIVGTIGFFSVAMILSGFVNMLYSDTIRFLFIDMTSINYYHTAIFTQFFVAIYYTFTK